jgi:hypothetical protein
MCARLAQVSSRCDRLARWMLAKLRGAGNLTLLCALAALAQSPSAMAADQSPFVVEFALAGEGIPAGANFLLTVQPSWAPLGAQRFRELVEAGYYNDTRFFRVLDGEYDIWIAQFGVRTPTSPAVPRQPSCAVHPPR